MPNIAIRRKIQFGAARKGVSADAWSSAISAHSPILWFDFTETAGSTVTNNGSHSGNGTITSATLGQTGQLGANHAIDLDGVDDLITVTNHADFNNLTAFTEIFLVYFDTLGESNSGYLSYQDAYEKMYVASANDRFGILIDYDGNNVAYGPDFGTSFLTDWILVFNRYDENVDRYGHCHLGRNGALEAHGSTWANTPSTGSRDNTNRVNLVIGNITGTTNTMDGKLDEYVRIGKKLSDAECEALITIAGV